MRATDTTTPMLLLTDQEKQEAQDHFSQGYACKNQGDLAGALLHYTAAAKVGHPSAQNNLAVMYRRGEGVSRNDRLAFQLYLDAARHGNAVAQRNVGLFYLNGTGGVSSDFETAEAWLEAAWENRDVNACLILAKCYQSGLRKDENREGLWRRRAAELGDEESRRWVERSGTAAADPEYLRRLPLSMPPMDPARARASQHREFYTHPWSLPAAVLDGQIYYVARNTLCVSALNGSGARALATVEDFWGWQLAVSSAGVFLHTHQYENGRDVLRVHVLGLDGSPAGDHLLEADDYTGSSLYIVDDNLYYRLDGNGKCRLCTYNISTRTGRVLYDRASEIDRLCANERFVAFYGSFENGDLLERGWMLYELATGRTSCLDCTLSPEQVLDCPACYDEDSPFYVECPGARKIAAIDMAREILWTERRVQEAGERVRYWEPRPLAGGWDQMVPNVPIWRLSEEKWGSIDYGQVYFDGDRLFAAPDYYHFYGCTRSGAVHHWNMSHGHGCCDSFVLSGDLLLLDVDACGEKVYRADPEPSQPLGESWRSALPPMPSAQTPIPVQAPVPAQVPVTTQVPVTAPTAGPEPSGGGTASGDLEVVKPLTATNINYGILTLGSKFHIGFGVPVTVVLGTSRYSGRTHSTSKGRVDGLRQLFSEHALAQGDVLRARYAAAEATIYLSLA